MMSREERSRIEGASRSIPAPIDPHALPRKQQRELIRKLRHARRKELGTRDPAMRRALGKLRDASGAFEKGNPEVAFLLALGACVRASREMKKPLLLLVEEFARQMRTNAA